MLETVCVISHQFSISSKVSLNSGSQWLKITILRLPCSCNSEYNLGSVSKMHFCEIWKVERDKIFIFSVVIGEKQAPANIGIDSPPPSSL